MNLNLSSQENANADEHRNERLATKYITDEFVTALQLLLACKGNPEADQILCQVIKKN